jgi:Sec-independent protein translocase protein TatA
MKWLIIIGLLVILLVFLAMRFRRQIQAAIEIWRLLKKIKNFQPEEKTVTKSKIEQNKNETFVRCASCGNWIAESQALNLRLKIFYCSAECVEKSVVVNSRN